MNSKSKSPVRYTNNRVTILENRPTYIGAVMDKCIDELELNNDPNI